LITIGDVTKYNHIMLPSQLDRVGYEIPPTYVVSEYASIRIWRIHSIRKHRLVIYMNPTILDVFADRQSQPKHKRIPERVLLSC